MILVAYTHCGIKEYQATIHEQKHQHNQNQQRKTP